MSKLVDLVLEEVNKTLISKNLTTVPKNWREDELEVVNSILLAHPSISQCDFSVKLGYNPRWFSHRKSLYL